MASVLVSRSAKTIAATAAALASVAGLTAAFLASCAQTPTNVPVQTFEQPKNLDVVCLHVFDPNGTPIIPPEPAPESSCAQVPVNVTGAGLPFHLYALVTQTTRGEVAVVDLTAGNVVDIDPTTPGINFLPVGRLPSDIAATPDGRMAFVGSAAPNAPSIFALPTSRILGDSQSLDGGNGNPDSGAIIPLLTSWPVCALPQAPGAIRVLPSNLLPASADGGTASAVPGYVIVAVLPGDSAHSAKVVTIDPVPLLRGASGLQDAGLAAEPDAAVIEPGSLAPCAYLDEYPLELAAPAPGAVAALPSGPAWDDGVKWVDGGVDAAVPARAVACVNGSDAGGAAGGSALAGGTKPGGGATVLDTAGPRPLLYVADTALPLIHVIDLSDPARPVELAPLFATSTANPKRTVSVGQIAVSPTTREYKRFLYAIDRTEGSILIFDVTDPVNGPHVPLTRPHPEINPFQPPDRLAFGAPVASVAFVQHDWPLTSTYVDSSSSTALTAAETGLLCNPNPNINGTSIKLLAPEQGPFVDHGGYYRNANSFQQVRLGPYRLRGVFAFATLSSGAVITIDVDDWDAPCRRPDPLAPRGSITTNPQADALVDGVFSGIAPPQPLAAGPLDQDPYHVPVSFLSSYTDSPTTYEWFFPVSAPHRPRSLYYLRNDTIDGLHAPYLLAVPQLFTSGAPTATQGVQAVGNPSLVPTDTLFVDPSLTANPDEPNPSNRVSPLFGDDAGTADLALIQSLPNNQPNIRFAWEDPEVQADQDWTVTYEGTLPGFFDNGGNPLVLANVVAFNQLTVGGVTVDGGAPDFSAAWLANKDAYFCSKGVEDFTLGSERADADNAALVAANLPPLASYDTQVADYVQLTDDVLPSTDTYWTVPNSCWDQNDPASLATHNATCNSVFGETLDPTTPSLQRDFPILEAHDDKLLIGRFGYTGGTPVPRTAGDPKWIVVGRDPGNAPFLKLMQCCFHNQVHFNVRTGGQWRAYGGTSGFLHHVVATGSDARCAPSCEARDALLNGRSAPVTRPQAEAGTTPLPCTPTSIPSITRDSVLAMRNPMFSFLIWNGQDQLAKCADRPPVRDMVWAFSTRGQYSPLALNLASSSASLSPQSMRFIDSLGQLAVVDGASQGLILIDLNTISEAHAPYF